MFYVNTLIPEQIGMFTGREKSAWETLFDGGTIDLTEWKRTPVATYTRAYPEEKRDEIKYSERTVALTTYYLDKFYKERKVTFEKVRFDRNNQYETFKLPKRSGGFRTISAPKAELKSAQSQLAQLLSHVVPGYHTAAYAYIPGRWTKDAVERHQNNQSQWFMKTDLHDFFGSSNKDFVMSQIMKIIPFPALEESLKQKHMSLEDLLDICFIYNEKERLVLPQGSPASPMLTNLIMIPVDYAISRWCSENHVIYTRYADDMLFSARLPMDKEKILAMVHDCLHGTPYLINEKKTRYGSVAGSNWNLGMILNKENNITIGYKNKQELKAILNSFILDTVHGKTWEMEDVYAFCGKLNYYHDIEPEYIKNLIDKYTHKYAISFKDQVLKTYGIKMKL